MKTDKFVLFLNIFTGTSYIFGDGNQGGGLQRSEEKNVEDNFQR